MKQILDTRTLRFFYYFSRAYPSRSLLMVFLLIVSGLAEGIGLLTLLPLIEFAVGKTGAAQSDLTRTVVEVFQSIGVPPGLGPMLGVIVAAMTLKAVFRWMATKQVGYTVAQMATDLRLRLIRALLNARWSFFARKPTGFFANAISSEAQRASNAYRMACQATAGCIQVAIYLGVVVMVSWEVALISAVVAPLLVLALQAFVRMSRQAGDEQTRIMRQLIGRITSLLPGIKPVKAMARERHLLPFLEEETKGFNEARQRSVLATESLTAFQEPVIVLALAAGLYGAVTLSTAPASAVLVAAVLFYRVMTTASNLQSQYQAVTVNESAFWSLMETVEEAEDAAEDLRSDGKPAPPLREGIRVDGVSFAYEDEVVLSGADMVVPAGDLVALMGPSGAGKTTLVDLVTGLLQPDEGRILIDGVPLDDIDLADWRRQVGYVPQDMLLFNDTVFQNVTLGDETFDRDDVERALKAAGAWSFVKNLPEGMASLVGERGGQLSGGQRQRIGIARALVSRPRLIILDEATTALDPDTEREVCRTMIGLRGEATILAISHQPAIQDAADRIYTVSGGKITPKPGGVAVEEVEAR